PYRIYLADLDTDLVEFRDVPEQFYSAPELTPSGDFVAVTVSEGIDVSTSSLYVFDTRSFDPPLVVPHVVAYAMIDGPDVDTVGARLLILRNDASGEQVLEVQEERGTAGSWG